MEVICKYISWWERWHISLLKSTWQLRPENCMGPGFLGHPCQFSDNSSKKKKKKNHIQAKNLYCKPEGSLLNFTRITKDKKKKNERKLELIEEMKENYKNAYIMTEKTKIEEKKQQRGMDRKYLER
jgi:hypothetical protein